MPILEQCFLKSGEDSYYKIGNGYPLVLLHGFAETYITWQPILASLSEKYQLIIPHNPGCGTTNMHAGKLSMESIADFVHEVIKEEQLDNTILFGHSMGGYAAMAFLASHPEKLDGISLVHSSAKADSEEKKEIRQTANNFINLHGKELFLKNLIPKLYSSLQNYSHEKEQHLAMAMQYSNEQIIACYKAMMERPDRTHLLSQTNIPIQFIAGRADQSIALTDVLEQSKLVKLEILEGIGHSSMFENPKLLLAAIIGFADDILASFKS